MDIPKRVQLGFEMNRNNALCIRGYSFLEEPVCGFIQYVLKGSDITKTSEENNFDLDKVAMNYLLHDHKSPLSIIMHQADLHSEIQYHEDIINAFKAGYELGIQKAQKGGDK